MIEKVKNWFMTNQKTAIIGAVVLIAGFFLWKKMSRKTKYNRLMRRV